MGERQFRKGFAVSLREEGYTVRAISQRVNVPKSTVLRWCTEVARGKVLPGKSPGRPRKVTARSERRLNRLVQSKPFQSSWDLLEEWGEAVCTKTVRNTLKRLGFKLRKPPKKILLSKEQMVRRESWAMRFCLWREVQWRRVVFSDEAHFRRYTGDGRFRLWTKREAGFIPVQRGGPTAMVWAAIWVGGRTDLIFIEGSITDEKYMQVLENHVFPLSYQLGDPQTDWQFMDDNAPVHRGCISRAYKQLAGIRTLQWPPYSPDMNPIENIWGILKFRVRKSLLQNPTPDWRNVMQTTWQGIPQEILDNSIKSMRKRCQKLVQRRGQPLKY